MFRLLWKLIKWSTIAFILLLIGVTAWVIINPPDEEKVANCIATHGEIYCDAYGDVKDKEAVDAKIAKAKEKARLKAEQEAIKAEQEKKAKLAEMIEKAKSQAQDNARYACLNFIRNNATYPSKVKFKTFSIQENIWENFNKQGKFPNRYSMTTKVEMMNGFGAMIPHTAHCKVDFNSVEAKLVDLLVY